MTMKRPTMVNKDDEIWQQRKMTKDDEIVDDDAEEEADDGNGN
jgi:hypothetical protein